jgi:enoyl-[acyl-carrier-protein] reductase (NADH)
MNNNINNLVNFALLNDIKIINKYNKLKNTNIIIKECEQKKKKEINSTKIILSNLIKLNQYNYTDIRNVTTKLEEKIYNIDNIINNINNIKDENNKNNFIEYYTN